MDDLLRKLDGQLQEAFTMPRSQNSNPDALDISYPSLKLPKIHSLIHYTHLIKLLGTPDNFDTEVTEHQHIADCKVPYLRSNKRDPQKQMVKFISRRSALATKYEFLEFYENSTELKENFKTSLGGQIRGYITLESAEMIFGLNLEGPLRTYLEDCNYPEGRGHYHRRRRAKWKQYRNLKDMKVYTFLHSEYTFIQGAQYIPLWNRLKYFRHSTSRFQTHSSMAKIYHTNVMQILDFMVAQDTTG